MSADLKRGDLLLGGAGTYLIKSLIDRGGVGAVFEAQTVSDRNRVAIKILHGGRFPLTDVAKERFRCEIAKTLRLKHPFLIQAHDFGKIDEHDFLVMEYLPGGTIASQVERGKYNDETALRWCAQLVHGVNYLHSQSCIHRDLKPNNLLLTENGDLKISDLGILRDNSSEAYLTLSGDQIGSLLYISRHQRFAPAEASIADDAYSVACCLYEILARQRIHVYPEHLTELIGDRFPVYFCDLIMGCIADHESCKALTELGALLSPHHDGESHLSVKAKAASLNSPIILVSNSKQNLGLQRKRLASVAPLSMEIRRTIASREAKASDLQAAFISDKLLVATEDIENGASQIPVSVLCAKTLETITNGKLISAYPRIATRDADGRLIVPFESQVYVYDCQESGLVAPRQVAVLSRPGLQFHSMTVVSNQRRPLVSIGSWTEAPVFVNTHTGECRRLKVDPNVNWNGLGQTSFYGTDRIVVHYDGNLVVYKLDAEGDGEDRVVATYPFPKELVGIAASERLGLIFACHSLGIECIRVEDAKRMWFLPVTYDPGGRPLLLNANEDILAVECRSSLSDTILALVDPVGLVMAYLPRSYYNDGSSCRRMNGFDWAPSSRAICISYDDGSLEIFGCK